MGLFLQSLLLSLPLIGANAIFALGLVLIYRASRMLNLAHGAMAMVPAYAMYVFSQWGLPVPLALLASLVVGGLLGFAVERTFVTRLRSDGPTAQTVGTVAALGILIALVARTFGTAGLPAVDVFPRHNFTVGTSLLTSADLGMFGVMAVVALALYVLVQRTDLGLIMRGTAESRLAASLMGVDPARITSYTWILGGTLAGLGGVLLAPVNTTITPYSLALQVLPAFIAALIGGLGSLPAAVGGAVIVGLVQGLVPVLGPIGRLQGAPQLFLAVLAIVVMATRGRSLVAADDAGAADARAGAAGPSGSRTIRPPRRKLPPDVRLLAIGLGLAAVVGFPYLPGMPSSIVASANLAAAYGVIAVSLVLLTGWVGQISLGHAALVGIGAYATGHAAAGLGIPFPLSLPFAALASGLSAAVLGAVALRVRGLYLAVATLVFSWMASEFLFLQDWFISKSQIPARAIGKVGTLPFFDFTDRRTFFLVSSATLALAVLAAANIRDSKSGRAFFAIRGSEMAAASLGINVMRYKLAAFAASGALAGIAGNLIMTDARTVTSDQFTFNISLFFVSIAVVGGLTSLGGAVASGVVFASLTEVFYRVPALGNLLELVSSLLLAVVLLAYRGGLASIPARAQARVDRTSDRLAALLAEARVRLGRERADEDDAAHEAKAPALGAGARAAARLLAGGIKVGSKIPLRTGRSAGPAAPLDFGSVLAEATETSVLAEGADAGGVADLDQAAARARIAAFRPTGPRDSRPPLIEADGVTVQFGGLIAVNNASLQVREGEIVGLIGPNGAGKTTFFNAMAGYNSPSSGSIRLYGQDVTDLPVYRRAKVGVARTFQLIQLFRELTVYENLLVATHVHNPTGLLSHIGVSSRSLHHERQAVERVRQIIDLLDLGELADRRTADLPFGALRMVEVARALVTGFRVIMLDEPASGLDHVETDKLIDVLRFVRGLGVTLLLIEHDVRMVTGVSDHLYVLDQGRIIASGPPEEIQRNPEVIAAYLGEPVEAESTAVEALV